MKITGTGVSDGIAIAQAYIYRPVVLVIPEAPPADAERETVLFREALEKAKEKISSYMEQAAEKMSEKEAEVFDAHLMILEDDFSVGEPIEELIRGGLNGAKAIQTQFGSIREMFAAVDDPIFQERATDIVDLERTLLGCFLGVEDSSVELPENCIFVAEDLTPSDTMGLDMEKVAGIITSRGGFTSHSAIIARTLGIPYITGIEAVTEKIAEGTLLTMDGGTGLLVTEPDEAALEAARAGIAKQKEEEAALALFRGKPSATADGVEVLLSANMGTPGEVHRVLAGDADGVGLFRSEFLYLDRDAVPGEEEQTAAYQQVLSAMGEKPVIIRTLDIGGDKEMPALNLPKEDNPFLGMRAIRLCLKQPHLLRTQLRALLRAGVKGDLHIMFPMIADLGELREAKKILQECREELIGEGLPAAEHVKVGIMVETPASAVMARDFAREIDFFSVGTNDLTQYVLAAERGNENVAYLYSPYHPAVLRLIAMAGAAAQEAGILCGMCGEAANMPDLVPVWIGMGLRELSGSPRNVLKCRSILAGYTLAQCQELARRVTACATEAEVKEILAGEQNR